MKETQKGVNEPSNAINFSASPLFFQPREHPHTASCRGNLPHVNIHMYLLWCGISEELDFGVAFLQCVSRRLALRHPHRVLWRLPLRRRGGAKLDRAQRESRGSTIGKWWVRARTGLQTQQNARDYCSTFLSFQVIYFHSWRGRQTDGHTQRQTDSKAPR